MSSGDPLGQAIQDHVMGQSGILTGTSGANVIGYNQHAQFAHGAGYHHSGRARERRPYVMTPLLQHLLDAVPTWVHIALGAVCLCAVATLLLLSGAVGSGGDDGWIALIGMSVAAGALGCIAIRSVVTIMDLTWKLCVGVAYLALGLAMTAAAGGVIYMVASAFL